MSVLSDDDNGNGNDLFNDNIADGLEDDNEQLFGDEPAEAEDNEGGGDEATGSATATKVQPKKRTVNPRPRLTIQTLRGPRGLHTIEDYFKDIKYKGKGYEREDLDEVMKRLQHWGHRMYPTYKFEDVLNNIEKLGKKKELQVHMTRYRLGMLESMRNHDEIVDAPEDEEMPVAADEPYDEFDALLDEQIAISKITPRTPGPSTSKPSSSNYTASSSHFATPSFSKANAVMSTPYSDIHNMGDTSDLATPLPPSQPGTPAPKPQLTSEQLARIAENRRLAQERLAAKKLAQQQAQQAAEV